MHARKTQYLLMPVLSYILLDVSTFIVRKLELKIEDDSLQDLKLKNVLAKSV